MKKYIALSMLVAGMLIGCGGGSGGNNGSNNSSLNKKENTKKQIVDENKDTDKEVLPIGKWQEEDAIIYLNPNSAGTGSKSARRTIYKEYDGEYGKGIMETTCFYIPERANWNKMVSYDGIDCPATDYSSIYPRSVHLPKNDEFDDSEDKALIGEIRVDGVRFVKYFYGQKSFSSLYVPTENSYESTPKIINKTVKVNPSSDNRSLICTENEIYVAVPKSNIEDVKFYRYRMEIQNGNEISKEYFPNCVSKLHINHYYKYSKTEVISDKEYEYEAQIGRDDDSNAYISKTHYKKID